jgi:septal ring factor EnvC (AmiA/AmiB activator)
MAEDDMLKSELAKAAKDKAKMEKMIAEQQQYLQYLREQQQELRASAPREKGNAAQKPTVQTRSVSTSPLQITHTTSPQKDTFSIDSPSAMPAPASKTASPGSSLGSQSKQSSPAARPDAISGHSIVLDIDLGMGSTAKIEISQDSDPVVCSRAFYNS